MWSHHFTRPSNVPDSKESKVFLARNEVKFKLLLSDIDLGRKLPGEGERHFALQLRANLEQLRVDTIENPKILCAAKREGVNSEFML